MMRRRIPLAVAMIAAAVLGAGCGGSNYSSDVADGVPVTGVVISETTLSLLKGGTRQLSASLVPSNATERRMTWATSDKNIATVTTTGLVAGTGIGTAVITVTTADGGKTASCTVTVSLERIAVTGVTLDPADVTVNAGGSPSTIVARVEPPNATDKNVTWSVADPTIASLTGSGASATISGLKIGTTTVTAISQDDRTKLATATVHVKPVAVTGVALSQAELTLQAPKAGTPNGDAVPLTATIAPSDASSQEVSWTTSDAAVATVTSTAGKTVTVVAHKEGTATITVKTVEGGFTQSCKVTVVPPPAVNVPVSGISVIPGVISLEVMPATSTIVSANVLPADATNKKVYWTTSNSAIAALSPVTGGTTTGDSVTGSAVIVTATGLGMAKLTATTEDGGKQVMADVGVYMLDADLSGTLASTSLHQSTGETAYWDTRLGGGAPQEVRVGKLVFFADNKGFQNGGAGPTGGINIYYYAAGSTPAEVGVAIPQLKGYVAIPAEFTVPPGGQGAVRVSVTAAAPGGTPTLALVNHATGVPIDIKPLTGTPPFVFDGVPAGLQLDLIDGAVNGGTLNISHVRVEPTTTPAKDITPPADVTAAIATVAGPTSLTVSWTNPANSDLERVEISCVSTTAVSTVNVAKTAASSYTFTGLTTGVTYTFRIRSVDTSGLKSGGVTVSGSPASLVPLLDETLFAQWCTDYLTTTAGAQLTIPPSKLAYFAPSGTNYFKGMGGNRVMFNGVGFAPTAVGGTANPSMYVAVPASVATTTMPSVKLTILATQYQNLTTTNLALLSSTNKVLGALIVDAGPGSGSGGTPRAYIFDGVVPNSEIRISSDQKYFIITGVKVEPSTAAVQYQ